MTFANVLAVMALFIALGGTGYAALTLPKNSVGNKQIKKNAVTSSKVKNHSLKKVDFAKNQLPAGKQGVQGPQGVAGAQGPTGPTGATGAAGEAVAYARVGADGTLSTGTPAQSKNVVQANIAHTASSGIYCIGGLSFAPASAVVTTDNADAMATSNQIASVAVQRGQTLNSCDATHQQARVVMNQVDQTNAPTLTDHGFYIWFEK
jgi:hypothetical protein